MKFGQKKFFLLSTAACKWEGGFDFSTTKFHMGRAEFFSLESN